MSSPLPSLVAAGRRLEYRWIPATRQDAPTRILLGIHCPVLVIQGEEDRYGTAAQLYAIERGASGPVETMMLAGCGHAPHAEQPEIVLAAMVRFIGAVRPIA